MHSKAKLSKTIWMIIKKEGSTSLVTPLYVHGPLGRSVCRGLNLGSNMMCDVLGI